MDIYIYAGDTKGNLYSISPKGKERWNYEVNTDSFSAPVVDKNGRIYFADGNSNLHALNSEGTEIWTFSTEYEGHEIWENFSPAIGSDGTLYYASGNKLYALGPSSPNVNITSPNQKKIYKDSVAFEWEGNRVGRFASFIDHYEVKIDEENWKDVGEDTSYRFDDLEEGKHIVKVKAVAGSGNNDIDSVGITVYTPPELDIRTPTVEDIFNTSTVTVVWTSSDGSGIDHHEVKINNDNWKDVGQSTEYTFEEVSDGEHVVRVKAVDNTGNSTEKSVNFTVDTTPPTADAGEDIEVGISEQFTLDGTGSTDNIGIELYKWMINGETYNKKVVNLSIDEIGKYTAELTVIDIAGNTGIDSITVTVVDNVDPTADAGEDRTVKVDEGVIFDASNSSDNVEITSYEWDFDDGITANGETVTHKFDEKGTYEVTLNVIDEAGNTDMDTVTVTVEKKDDNGGNGIPGFTIFTSILGIYLAVLYRYKRRNM